MGMEPMLTTTEVSRLLHIHPNTLRRWTDEGMITAYRVGPRADRRYREDDIGRFLNRVCSDAGPRDGEAISGRDADWSI